MKTGTGSLSYRGPARKISVTASWASGYPKSGNRHGGGWSLGLSLSLPLFSSGITYYPNTVKAAKTALKSAEESLKEMKLALENDILSAYNDFLNSRDTALASGVRAIQPIGACTMG